MLYLVNGLNQEVIEEVPLLMCDPLYRNKKFHLDKVNFVTATNLKGSVLLQTVSLRSGVQ